MADLVARIAGLWRYPVKACAGEAVEALQLDTDGWPEGDCGWGIVDDQGELTWMGAHPRLARVKARLLGPDLELRGHDGMRLRLGSAGAAVEVRAWNGERAAFDHLQAQDGGDDAAALLRATTGARLRLVRLGEDARRRPGLNALHLVCDGSLQAWREALPTALDRLPERVRPNLLLSAADGGELPPFIEDLMTGMHAGDLALRRTSPCVRCIVPTVDPGRAEFQPQALDALTALSTACLPGAPVQFGIYAQGQGPGRLRVGDRAELTLDFGAA